MFVNYLSAIYDLSEKHNISKSLVTILLKRTIEDELALRGDCEINVGGDGKLKFAESSQLSAYAGREFRLTEKVGKNIIKHLERALEQQTLFERKKFLRDFAASEKFIQGKIIKAEKYGFIVDTAFGQAFLPNQNISEEIFNNNIEFFTNKIFEIKKISFIKDIFAKIILAYSERKILNYLIFKYIDADNAANGFINKKTNDIVIYSSREVDKESREKIASRLLCRNIKFAIRKEQV